MNERQKEIQEKMMYMLGGLNIAKLKELIQLAYKDQREGAGMVFMLALGVLEAKIPEAQYVEFLNGLN